MKEEIVPPFVERSFLEERERIASFESGLAFPTLSREAVQAAMAYAAEL